MQRVTIKQLEEKTQDINAALAERFSYYSNNYHGEESQNALHIGRAYGGFQVQLTCPNSTGVWTLHGYGTKREALHTLTYEAYDWAVNMLASFYRDEASRQFSEQRARAMRCAGFRELAAIEDYDKHPFSGFELMEKTGAHAVVRIGTGEHAAYWDLVGRCWVG